MRSSISINNVPQEDKATGEKGTSFDASVIEDDTITNLYDAFGKKIDGLTKDFGFSVLLKYKGKLIRMMAKYWSDNRQIN